MLAYLRLGLVIALCVAAIWFRSHYIEVGRKQVEDSMELARLAEAQRQGDVKAVSLEDAIKRIDELTKANNELQSALNSSEVLNNAEADNTCLSDARRLRIDSIR